MTLPLPRLPPPGPPIPGIPGIAPGIAPGIGGGVIDGGETVDGFGIVGGAIFCVLPTPPRRCITHPKLGAVPCLVPALLSARYGRACVWA